MYFKSFALVASLAASAIAKDITIMVGMNGTKTFTPAQTNASIGDIINFVFVAGNHSVRQSTFPDPCSLKAGGFTNDFQPVKADAGPSPVITLAVNVTTPIWFYCPQTVNVSHCHAGMVGAINPTAENTFEAFQALAIGNTTAAGNTTAPAAGSTTTPAAGNTPTTTPTSPNSASNSSTSGNHTSGAVAARLRPSVLLTGSSAALLGAVASAMLAL